MLLPSLSRFGVILLHCAGRLSWAFAVAVYLLSVLIMGASQHQLGGVIHEGTHYILFAGPHDERTRFRLVRRLSDLHIDLRLPHSSPRAPSVRQRSRARSEFRPGKGKRPLARFPRCPYGIPLGDLRDCCGCQISFAILWLAPSIRRSASIPTLMQIPVAQASPWVVRMGVLFALGAPVASIVLLGMEPVWASGTLLALWAIVCVYYAVIPDEPLPEARSIRSSRIAPPRSAV